MSETIDDTEDNGAESQVFVWGDDVTIARSEVPVDMLWVGFTRALPHVFSNEVSSRALQAAKRAAKAGELPALESTDEESKARIADFRRNAEAESRAYYKDLILKGLWGSMTRGPSGPRIDPLEAEYERIVSKALRIYLGNLVKSKSIARDKASKTWYWFTDGVRESRTFEEAYENYEAGLSEDERQTYMVQAQETVAANKRAADVASRPAEKMRI